MAMPGFTVITLRVNLTTRQIGLIDISKYKRKTLEDLGLKSVADVLQARNRRRLA
jgi:hypothetical protein